jgi:transcription termination factor NusB
MNKTAVIRKLPNGKWTVKSLKGKNLGEYDTKEDAVKNLRRIEYFKAHPKKRKKKAEEVSYSSVMRKLNKESNNDVIEKFQKEFKKSFDEGIISGKDEPEKDALNHALESIKAFEKSASAIDLGNAEAAGAYLANLVKFLLRRISNDRRPHAIDSMKKKIYYINEYNIAAKKTPPSSSMGQAITLIKTILLEHHPEYIRNVLNSIVRNL